MHYHGTEYNVDLRHTNNRGNPLKFEIEFLLSDPERKQVLALTGKSEKAVDRIITNSQSSSRVKHSILINPKTCGVVYGLCLS